MRPSCWEQTSEGEEGSQINCNLDSVWKMECRAQRIWCHLIASLLLVGAVLGSMVRDCWDSVPPLTLIWSKWSTHLSHRFLFLQRLQQHLLGWREALPPCLLVPSDKKVLGVLIVSTFENKILWTYLGYLYNQWRHCGANKLEIISRQWRRKHAFVFFLPQSEFCCHHVSEADRVLFLWLLHKSSTAFFKNGTNHHSALGIL